MLRFSQGAYSSGVNSRLLQRWYVLRRRLAHVPTSSSQISSFLGDYQNALNRAQAFDNKVASDATKISADYASIVALSIRQALGATEITISKNGGGTFNTSDVLVFMKGEALLFSLYILCFTSFFQKYRATGLEICLWASIRANPCARMSIR